MGEKGTGDKPEPTLELPSLRPSLRRRKRSRAAAPTRAAAPETPDRAESEKVATPPAEVAVTEDTDPVHTELVAATSDVTERSAGQAEVTDPVDIESAAAPGGAGSGTDSRPASGKSRRGRGGPLLPALTAVVLTGLLVGLVGTGATFGGLQACEVAGGTSSCGDPGFFVLVVIVIVMMLLGAVLLKALQVPEAKGVSFLGVGLLCVIVLVGLVDALFSPWMFLIVPALTAPTFAVGRWVTTRFVDPAEDEPGYDVR